MKQNVPRFHTIVDRRDYLKNLGLWAFGYSDNALSLSLFHDIDELISYRDSHVCDWPWWVRELDYNKPTTEIDWNKASRFDFRHLPQCIWQGERETAAWVDLRDGDGTSDRLMRDFGRRLKYVAHQNSQRYVLRNRALTEALFNPSVGKFGQPEVGFKGPAVPVLAQARVNKWSGTLEEASTMLWQVCILFGASDVSLVELNPATTRKLVASHEFHDGKPYVFEDVPQAYETGATSVERKPQEGKRVIPERCRWLIHFSLNEVYEWPYVFSGDSWLRYAEARQIQYRLQAFIKGLGYQAIGPCNFTNNMTENIALAVLGGEAELGRNNMAISPLLGTSCGQYSSIITDLPLAPSKPVDAGIHHFCHTCQQCAEACPGGAISRAGQPGGEIKNPLPGKVLALFIVGINVQNLNLKLEMFLVGRKGLIRTLFTGTGTFPPRIANLPLIFAVLGAAASLAFSGRGLKGHYWLEFSRKGQRMAI
ncbi:Tetrachloroethene reductive dehalogenase TceA [Dehalococcoides mccartyi]|uniref:Tetrachloroethene reductive dehalogenase TceA n=1 Tax=Dehalococcoides mccartyi TaxID=61435 RepID=A0A328END4_9CHLR|nr:Tetrachloroethene reductive dehalogenase TceA [Dehalococcoides mccartyi]